MKTSAKYFRLAVGPRWGTSSQNGQNYNVTHKKPETQNKFFNLLTRILAESFEGFNSPLAQSAEELCGW